VLPLTLGGSSSKPTVTAGQIRSPELRDSKATVARKLGREGKHGKWEGTVAALHYRSHSDCWYYRAADPHARERATT
jgi:hypothetical protein